MSTLPQSSEWSTATWLPCSSEAWHRSCSRACILWRWPEWRSTPATARIPSVALSGPPCSWARPPSDRASRPKPPSVASARSMRPSPARPTPALPTLRRIRISCRGCTSPRSAPSSRPISAMAHETSLAPRSVAELEAQLTAYRPELSLSRHARAVRNFVLVGVRRTPHEAAAYGILSAAAQGVLPRWARHQLRLPSIPLADRLAVQPAATFLTGALRWVVPPAA